MNWYKLAQVKLEFENIHEDYRYEQNDYQLLAKLEGSPVGGIDYSEYKGVLAIQYMLVKPELRRQGIGTALMEELKRLNETEFENKPIKWGILTDEGYAFNELPKH